MINQVIMGVMAAGAVLGGIDWIFGNKRGYGKKMEEALMLLGPTALSMAGIICLVPFLAKTLGGAVSPLYRMAGMDPGMFGGQETLVLNANHPLVRYLGENQESEHAEVICQQLYDLAMISHKPLSPEEMTKFVQRSNEIMLVLTK